MTLIILETGTGACAVYPLLAVVKNKWHMVATETDPTSLQKSEENVARNNLQQFIQSKSFFINYQSNYEHKCNLILSYCNF